MRVKFECLECGNTACTNEDEISKYLSIKAYEKNIICCSCYHRARQKALNLSSKQYDDLLLKKLLTIDDIKKGL